jgi:outer membrane protein OmpA-like peptidoglycan-associated protein
MQGREDKFPGSTSLSFSRKTFTDLKAGSDTPFIAYENPMNTFFKSFKHLVSGSGDPAEFLNRVFSAAPGATPPPTPAIHYTLRRAGADVAFPVLVNNQQVELPALHVICLRSDGSNDGDAYIFDDPSNPLILAGQTKPNGTAQMVKIYWNSDAPKSNPIEEQLQKEGRAKIYGIYFDFGSNQIRAESEPVLEEIAQAMRAHPDWKLRIEGHTDNIGGDAYNQNLSSSRADAVKKALTAGYTIGEGRLTTQGLGDTHPAASNDTLEGRALNRRVELVRN